ncbi:hypothetical protein GCM10011321_13160 [Youhaiella tibetensis]|nr:hypothetical protein GCM10011321_13160 [Youhaiella tibetensis]
MLTHIGLCLSDKKSQRVERETVPEIVAFQDTCPSDRQFYATLFYEAGNI